MKKKICLLGSVCMFACSGLSLDLHLPRGRLFLRLTDFEGPSHIIDSGEITGNTEDMLQEFDEEGNPLQILPPTNRLLQIRLEEIGIVIFSPVTTTIWTFGPGPSFLLPEEASNMPSPARPGTPNEAGDPMGCNMPMPTPNLFNPQFDQLHFSEEASSAEFPDDSE
ncbi:MAG: hypothetical protein LBO73_00785 [Holosporaceae bacterium]|nr:hypothetical protein [Holosporaceae bacterium]